MVKNLMAKVAVIKEIIKPDKRKIISLGENERFDLRRSKPVAAAMVGKASKKENSTASVLESPMINPPTMVAADRETPGMMARDWNRPKLIKFFGFKESIWVVVFLSLK